MKWFMNLSIQAKLLATFVVVALFFIVLGILGYYGTSGGRDAGEEMFANRYRAVQELDAIGSMLLQIQSDLQRLPAITNPVERRGTSGGIEEMMSRIDQVFSSYRERVQGTDIRPLQEKFSPLWTALKKDIVASTTSFKNAQGRESRPVFDATLRSRFEQCQDALGAMVRQTDIGALAAQEAHRFQARWILIAILVLVLVGAAFSALIGIKLAGSIRHRIGGLVDAAGSLAAGDLETRLEVTTTNELGKLADSFNSLAQSLREQAAEAEQISLGNLNVNIRQRSEKDILSKSRNHVVTILKSLLDETNSLLRSAREGQLEVRGDSRRFNGGYREIIDGVNKTLDAVVTPLKESSDILSVMATGDFSGRVEGEYRGDHQIMKKSVNELAVSLSSAIRDVTEVVTATASSSTEISSSIEEMAAGAQNQSLQTAEIAGAIEEMTSTILENSKNANRALDTARRASQVAQDGGKVVLETVQYMNKIADVVKKSAGTVQTLGKSSDQIGEIIQVIEDIADQTNLLALNAAIEAARAGEQGRGFAVVADEVRKLAERTTKATKEISHMIKRIQSDTGGAVKSMEEGTHEVDQGIELAHKAGMSLDVIVTVVAQLTDMATQIAAGSEQQSSAAEQISKNIEAIRNVTHEYAGGIQEMARATSDLNKLMEQLQRLISHFRINARDSRNSPERPEQHYTAKKSA